MTFDQFYPILSVGAMGIVVALLGWTVRSSVTLSKILTTAIGDIQALSARVLSLEANKDHHSALLSGVKADVSYIRGRLEGSPTTHVPAAVPRPARRTAKAKE